MISSVDGDGRSTSARKDSTGHRPGFRTSQFVARAQAILDATHGLLANRVYLDSRMTVSDPTGTLIEGARERGELRIGLRDALVPFTLYARSCDTTLGFLKASGSILDDDVVQQVVDACFDGLAASGAVPAGH
ncbi:MAG: hypothetical protein JSW68_09100 [Burkholderiales bacterium]|nr:MAG: hypothetical protein JSW68_09100 [Burkholderiales bacterium]